MVTIIFESHATSLDNEVGLASGWYDVELSELGEKQARELGQGYKDQALEAIFCSDLKRSYRTAEIAFAGRGVSIVKDKRLRECDYGDLTRKPKSEVDVVKGRFIAEPYPHGQSYEDTTVGMRDFLCDLLREYDHKEIMIIGSQATQYGLEHLINGVPPHEAVTAPWKWHPAEWTRTS